MHSIMHPRPFPHQSQSRHQPSAMEYVGYHLAQVDATMKASFVAQLVAEIIAPEKVGDVNGIGLEEGWSLLPRVVLRATGSPGKVASLAQQREHRPQHSHEAWQRLRLLRLVCLQQGIPDPC